MQERARIRIKFDYYFQVSLPRYRQPRIRRLAKETTYRGRHIYFLDHRLHFAFPQCAVKVCKPGFLSSTPGGCRASGNKKRVERLTRNGKEQGRVGAASANNVSLGEILLSNCGVLTRASSLRLIRFVEHVQKREKGSSGERRERERDREREREEGQYIYNSMRVKITNSRQIVRVYKYKKGKIFGRYGAVSLSAVKLKLIARVDSSQHSADPRSISLLISFALSRQSVRLARRRLGPRCSEAFPLNESFCPTVLGIAERAGAARIPLHLHRRRLPGEGTGNVARR